MDEYSVELRGVSKRFGATTVLDHVSLQVQKGEFFSLLGPSGCGKTTTLRIIAGFEHPDSGELLINGQPALHIPPHERDINLVFQHYALFPHLTVARNVAFGLEMQRRPRAEIQRRVAEALELVRLTGLEDRYPKQLSGGQQQRVALARALVTHPSVLLLDEPLGALDQKLRQEMQLELKRLQRQLQITFIYVTHDQEEALALSDRIAVMHRGRVLQVGTPEEIYEHPATRFVAEFIGESNLLEGEVVHVVGERALVKIGALQTNVFSRRCLKVGQRVTLALRPEAISLEPAPLQRPRGEALRERGVENGQWVGQIEELIYCGKETRYRVRLGSQMVLTVRGPHGLRLGESVYLGWSPHDIHSIGAIGSEDDAL
ncbi:MAG: ABC transporter ATP-binding protein [Candidatus Bipolaricaulota bacterium]|nr:ABC transporter ATP-binding protein [Candidatus Bipolaricaulota bacterium]MDW8110940.1 ABC transporter ATP-binding protein [Candidatus Bipolaricaulota bacterium]MDW8329100.1 ABC transporter ATP-binding protein [Candidatus Bipolaricaulota bacterium]